jgi:hypothetical protein
MTPDLATDAARSRLAKALQRQKELGNASITNPALEADYHRSVEEVAAADNALSKELSR